MRLSREDFRAQQTETERLRNESNDSTEANIQKNNQRQQASVTSSPDHGSMATQALIWQMHEEEQKTSGDHELARRLQESYSDFKCPICIETLSREDVFIVSTCLHEFCRPCIAEHINTQISAQCFPILCPCCNRTDPDCELSQQDLSILLETEDYERYLRSTLSLHISQTPSILSCPQPDCQGAAEVIPPETNFICPCCGFSTCVSCKVQWHSGQTCEQYQEWREENAHADERTSNLISELGFQMCPTCQNAVEKSEGCNHMTCRCGTHFCYVCAAKCDSNNPYAHFNSSAACPLFEGQ